MDIDLKHSKEDELLCYQIALLQVQVNCNEQLEKIKAKLEEIKKGNNDRRNNVISSISFYDLYICFS